MALLYGPTWFVIGRNQGQRLPAVGGGLGRGLAAFTLKAMIVFERSKSSVHRGIHHKHPSEKHLYTVVSNLLSILFFSLEERPKRPA